MFNDVKDKIVLGRSFNTWKFLSIKHRCWRTSSIFRRRRRLHESFKEIMFLTQQFPSRQMRAFRAVLDLQKDLFLCTTGNPLTSSSNKEMGMTTAAKREESYRKVRQGACCKSPEGSLNLKCALCHSVKFISLWDGCLLVYRHNYCYRGDSLL